MSGTNTNWKSRVWRYGPLVVWLGMIFFFSTGVMAASNTSRIIEPLLRWVSPGISETALQTAHFFVRKCAHFSEYALLAILAARAFSTSPREFLRRNWLLLVVGLCAVYSLSDEFHQSFVASRTASIYDSMIDTAGGLTAACLYWIWRKWRRPDRQYRRF